MTSAVDGTRVQELVREEVSRQLKEASKSATILVMSGDMDRVFAALACANAAAAMGKQTTVFFSFWGVSVLRSKRRVKGKPVLEQILAAMIPVGTGRLPLSRMNCGGLGACFFRWWMRKKHVQDLESLLEDARDLGVRIVSCEISMEMMGLRREEMIEGVAFAGVTSFVKEAGGAGMTLFV